jgi:hypothetical protein
MKYVLLFGYDPAAHSSNLPEHEQAARMGEVGAWWEKHTQAATLLDGARLQLAEAATTIRGGDKPVVTDGPFVEAKEVLGGYGLIDVADLDEALALAKTWPLLSAEGQYVEVRPVWEM